MSIYKGTDLVAGAIVMANAANQSLSNLDANGEARFSAKQDVISWGTSTSNVSTTRPAVVKETYKNGSNWYRVYSDNWVEQGGKISSSTVNLLKAYADTDYNLCIMYGVRNEGKYGYDHPLTLSESQFTVNSDLYGSSKPAYWCARGYIS